MRVASFQNAKKNVLTKKFRKKYFKIIVLKFFKRVK